MEFTSLRLYCLAVEVINWTVVFVAIITAVPSTIAAVNSWMGRKQSERNAEKLKTVEAEVNGRMSSLIKVTDTLAHAKGHAAGMAQERHEERKRKNGHPEKEKA